VVPRAIALGHIWPILGEEQMTNQEQLKQQIYDYLESLEWAMRPIEDMDYNDLVDCLCYQAQISGSGVAALRRTIVATLEGVIRLHSHFGNLIELLEEDGELSIYDCELDTLLDSMWAEFEQFLHIADTDTQTAKERPAGSGTESSPC